MNKQWLAGRVAFPTSQIKDGYIKTINENKLEDIIKEETVLANQANEERKISNAKPVNDENRWIKNVNTNKEENNPIPYIIAGVVIILVEVGCFQI